MSGYISGLLAMLAINIIIAYSVFVPASAGLLNLGAAGFVLVGAYSAGALTMLWEVPLWLAVPLGAVAAGLVAFLIAFPILRTRGIYMVLATFAFAEVVAGVLINIPALGGAAGLSVMAYAGLPVVAPAAVGVVCFVAWLMATRFGLSVRAIHDDENVAHLFGAFFFTLVPEALRKLSEQDPSLKFLEGGRYIVFGLAVVLLMMWRPQGVVTRTMLENLRSSLRGAKVASTDGERA